MLKNINTMKNFMVNFGPQHPAAHGVLRLILELNKRIETLLLCNTRRAQYSRVLLSKLTQVLNHLLAITTHVLNVGALPTFLWTFKKRKKLIRANTYKQATINLFKNEQVARNKIQKRYYSTNQKKEEKIDQAQTWSEYLYPYFTSEYYYVGQVATTVAVVTTAAVVYWYVAPAVASYWYGNTPNNNPTHNNNNISDPLDKATTINSDTLIQPNETDVKNNIENLNYSDKDMALAEKGYKRLYKVCEHAEKKIVELIKNNTLSNYTQDINSGKYTNKINTFFTEYDREKIENNELITPEVIKDIAVIETKQANIINKDIIKNIFDKLGRIDDMHELTEDLEIIIDYLATCLY